MRLRRVRRPFNCWTEISDADATERAKTYQVGAELAVLLGKTDLAEAYYRRQGRSLSKHWDQRTERWRTLSPTGALFTPCEGISGAGEKRLLRQALEIRQRALGHDHPETAHGLVTLAVRSSGRNRAIVKQKNTIARHSRFANKSLARIILTFCKHFGVWPNLPQYRSGMKKQNDISTRL